MMKNTTSKILPKIVKNGYYVKIYRTKNDDKEMWSRNNLIFKKQVPKPDKDAALAVAEVKEWIDATKGECNNFVFDRHVRETDEVVKWITPPIGSFKCNFDAAWMVRDHLGVVRYWGCARLGEVSSPIEAEGKALLLAIQNTLFLGFEDMISEGDCQLLIKHLNGESKLSTIHNLSLDISRWASTYHRHKFTYIARSSSEVAHCLAQQGPPNSIFYSSCNYPPFWLTLYLHKDYVMSRSWW